MDLDGAKELDVGAEMTLKGAARVTRNFDQSKRDLRKRDAA